MADMWSIKEMIQCADLGIPKEMKNAISISIAFCLDVLIRKVNKKPFEIIVHVGRVTSLQSCKCSPE